MPVEERSGNLDTADLREVDMDCDNREYDAFILFTAMRVCLKMGLQEVRDGKPRRERNTRRYVDLLLPTHISSVTSLIRVEYERPSLEDKEQVAGRIVTEPAREALKMQMCTALTAKVSLGQQRRRERHWRSSWKGAQRTNGVGPYKAREWAATWQDLQLFQMQKGKKEQQCGYAGMY